jgi:GxxExxY protein
MLYSNITEKIIASALNVHTALGNGFPEVFYQRAMEIEMPYQELCFKRELEMPVYYREINIGNRKVDFFVEDKIMLELKAVTELNGAHLSQTLNYLEASKKEIGLLFNFGARSLEIKRVHNNKIKK